MLVETEPQRVTVLVQQAVAGAQERRAILAVGEEAMRIAVATGLSAWAVAARLIEAGREAQIAMELPTTDQLSFRPVVPNRRERSKDLWRVLVGS
jgi:hypothetical protein